VTGLWGNRTFPGPGKNRKTCAFRREPLRFPRLRTVRGCRNGRAIRCARIRRSNDKSHRPSEAVLRFACVCLREQCCHVEGSSQTRCNLGFRLEPCAGWNYRSVSPDRAGGDSYSCRGPHADSPMRVAAASNREVSCTISRSESFGSIAVCSITMAEVRR
jgi:hypothetical protein